MGSSDDTILMVPVAAILVASIRLTFIAAELTLLEQGAAQVARDAPPAKGAEMGWFEHGSTILLFYPRPTGFTGRWWKGSA